MKQSLFHCGIKNEIKLHFSIKKSPFWGVTVILTWVLQQGIAWVFRAFEMLFKCLNYSLDFRHFAVQESQLL
jgi:hypothetical protein